MSRSRSSCPAAASAGSSSWASIASPSALAGEVEHDARREEPVERQLVDRLGPPAGDGRVVVPRRVDVRRVVRPERQRLARPALAVAQQAARHAEQRFDLGGALRVRAGLELGAQKAGAAGDDRRRQVDEPGHVTPPPAARGSGPAPAPRASAPSPQRSPRPRSRPPDRAARSPQGRRRRRRRRRRRLRRPAAPTRPAERRESAPATNPQRKTPTPRASAARSAAASACVCASCSSVVMPD